MRCCSNINKSKLWTLPPLHCSIRSQSIDPLLQDPVGAHSQDPLPKIPLQDNLAQSQMQQLLPLGTMQSLLLQDILANPDTRLLDHQMIPDPSSPMPPRYLAKYVVSLITLLLTASTGWIMHSKADDHLLNCMLWCLIPMLPMKTKNSMQTVLPMPISPMIWRTFKSSSHFRIKKLLQ